MAAREPPAKRLRGIEIGEAMDEDFEFIPPAEILSIERDRWWDNQPDLCKGMGYFAVKHKCVKGLIYITQTWAHDELEAYQQIMRGEVIAFPK